MESSTIYPCLLIAALFDFASSIDCTTSELIECSPSTVSIGCYDVDCLEAASIKSSPAMDVPKCLKMCTGRGFYYTGLFRGTECRCANAPPECGGEGYDDDPDRCGVPCSGDTESYCGGRAAVQIYSHPYDHPTIGDWWFDGPNNILECSATNVLNIVLVTEVKGSNLNGQWQLATWGSGGQNGDGKRYHDAALSLSLRQDSSSIGVPLRTIPKKVRWDMNRGPSCDEVGFLCIQLRRIGYAMNVTNPNASCHEIACERAPHRRFECKDNQCSCVNVAVVYPSSNLTDEEKLAVIEKVNITEETADAVLTEVLSLTYDDVRADAVTSTANVLESVVSLNSSDTKITRDVVAIIGNLMNSDPEELAAAQGMNQSSSRAMQALEQQLQIVDLTKNNGSFTSVQPNLAVQVQATTSDALSQGLTFVSRRSTVDDQLTDGDIGVYDHGDAPTDVNDIRSSINVKTQFADEFYNASTSLDMRIAFAVVREPSLFISNVDDHGVGSDGEPRGRRRPNTPVMSVTIEGFGLRKLQTDVTSVFHPIQTSNSSMIIDDPICVFWDFEANNGSGGWLGYGCSLVQNVTGTTDATSIKCTCNHTTNFAVIMNFHSPEQDEQPGMFYKASKYLSYIGCGLSIGSLIITLAVYLLSPKLRQKQPNQIFMNICLSLLLLYIAYILVVIFSQQPGEAVVDSDVDNQSDTEIEIWCFCLAALVQYFTLTSLLWMAVEGFNMYLLFVRVVNATITGFMTKASLVAWGIPVIAVGITGGISRRNYVEKYPCFLAQMPKLYGLLCPIGVIVVANIVIFTLVIIRLQRTIRTSSAKKDSFVIRVKESQQRLQKAICIFLLLGLTWSSGYFLLINTAFNQVFQIVFIVLNAFQGFFIFVIYCLRQRVVRAELSRLCGCAAASKKRRSISLASTGQREDTMKTRQTEMISTTIGRTYQDIERDISDTADAEIAEEQLETGPSNHGVIVSEEDKIKESSRPESSFQQEMARGTKSPTDPTKQRGSRWMSFAEIRQQLETVLSKGKRNSKHRDDMSSKYWAVGHQDKSRSMDSNEGWSFKKRSSTKLRHTNITDESE